MIGSLLKRLFGTKPAAKAEPPKRRWIIPQVTSVQRQPVPSAEVYDYVSPISISLPQLVEHDSSSSHDSSSFDGGSSSGDGSSGSFD